jgi:regulator of replication initiation timing
VSEKLRQVMEFKLAQKRLGELPRLLNADLFLASLKKPETVRGNVDTELTSASTEVIDNLKELVNLYIKASELLMEVERFLREDLASNITHIDVENHNKIKMIIDKINELQDKMIEIFADVNPYAVELSREQFNLYKILDFSRAFEDVRGSLYHVLGRLKDYLLSAYNLFSRDHLSEFETYKPMNLYELADEAKKDNLPDLASYIEKELAKNLGLVLLDPESFRILLDGNKVKRLYLTIKNQYEEFSGQYYEWRFSDSVIGKVYAELKGLRDSLQGFLRETMSLVVGAYKLRDIVTEFGYKSPSQRLTFFLPAVEVHVDEYGIDPLPDYIPDNLTFSSLFNDIAYVVHRVAEMLLFYANYLNNELGSTDLQVFKLKNCHIPLFSRINSGSLLNFGIAWLNTVCALMDGWIASEDKDPLSGYIVNDTTGWFRVGSSEGHATHVRKDGDTWVIDYYDTDKPVNKILGKLWSVIPGTEVYVDELNGVTVRTKDDNALPFIGAVLGFATSMDINIRHFSKDVYDAIVNYAKEISPQLALIAKAAFGAGK